MPSVPVPRIHILGASGSGTTTLAMALARRHRLDHLDTDDFFWQPTDPPFSIKRPADERLALLAAALDAAASGWVLSGSLAGWGDPLIARFDLVVFLFVEPAIRLARLNERERRRYGDAIAPGGPMHETHVAFMRWSAAYDSAGMEMRSRALHEAWLARLPGAVLRLDGAQPIETLVERVERFVTTINASV
jgi:adenylate kinase family enzyme